MRGRACTASRRLFVGLLALLFLAVLPAAAEATWLEPVAISPLGVTARQPQIAIDGAGNLTAVWTSGSAPERSIRSAFRPAGGPWQESVIRPGLTSASDCHDPRLAVAPAGAAVLVADCEKPSVAIRAAYRTSGVWGTGVEVPGSSGGKAARVDIDHSGNAIAAWAGGGSTVQSAYRAAAGSWSAGGQVSTVGKTALEPNVAMSPAGYAHAVWREKREENGGDPVIEVKSARKQGAAAWTAPARLTVNLGPGSTSPVAEGEPQLAMNEGGERMTAWLLAGTHLTLSERSSSSDLSGFSEPARSISEATAHVEVPRLALDGSGRGVATWRNFDTVEGFFRLRVATTSSLSGTWSTPETLAGPAGVTVGTKPDVAADPAGNAIVVWRAGTTVNAASRQPGGAFAPAAPISTSAHTGFEEPLVTMDAGGDAVAVWSANDMTSTHVAVAVNDATPPAISYTPPVPVVLGNAVGLIAVATDTWSATSLSWDFGDGGTASGSPVSHVYATAGAKTATVTATDAAGNAASVAIPITVTPAPSSEGPGGSGRSRVGLTARVVPQPWKKIAAAKALKLRCRLGVSGTCAGKASVGAGIAKRIGLKVPKGRKTVPIGRGSAQAAAGRFVVVKVKLAGKALAAIAAATQPVPVAIAVTGRAGGRDPATVTRRLKIRRP